MSSMIANMSPPCEKDGCQKIFYFLCFFFSSLKSWEHDIMNMTKNPSLQFPLWSSEIDSLIPTSPLILRPFCPTSSYPTHLPSSSFFLSIIFLFFIFLLSQINELNPLTIFNTQHVSLEQRRRKSL